MIFWVDAQLSPAIAIWINKTFAVRAIPVRDLGLRDSTDREIFLAARDQNAIMMTKDRDFVRLVSDLGCPPQVIWITCGNTSNASLKEILLRQLPGALQLLNSGEDLIEIG